MVQLKCYLEQIELAYSINTTKKKKNYIFYSLNSVKLLKHETYVKPINLFYLLFVYFFLG